MDVRSLRTRRESGRAASWAGVGCQGLVLMEIDCAGTAQWLRGG
jgi:hypothetical protein